MSGRVAAWSRQAADVMDKSVSARVQRCRALPCWATPHFP
jgi:hypothetical protein